MHTELGFLSHATVLWTLHANTREKKYTVQKLKNAVINMSTAD